MHCKKIYIFLFEIVKKDYWSKFCKKTPFKLFYFNISNLFNVNVISLYLGLFVKFTSNFWMKIVSK